MLILNINGTINSGKSTVSKILQTKIPNALFIEVDELISEDEVVFKNLSFHEGILERLNRLDSKIEDLKQSKTYDVIIFAYPLVKSNYDRWQKLADTQAKICYITLSPTLETCLKNRGTRELNTWEINRIKEMYEQNYHQPKETDFLIKNDEQSPEETAHHILEFLTLSNLL
ncbi:MAG: hypothetical protein PHE89_02365 [Alphaproteobacteria bacterium]|nr:hypothetical protein [Alphaproteobacteria bacterium]